MYDKQGRWNKTIMGVIDRANSADAEVIIVTASGQPLVKAITQEAGIKVRAVLGKTFSMNGNRRITNISFSPRGEGKKKVLEKHFGGRPLIHLACGDSEK
jgi:phosphoserine phosphatase